MRRAEHSGEPFLQEIMELDQLRLFLVSLVPGNSLELYAVAQSLGPGWNIIFYSNCVYVV